MPIMQGTAGPVLAVDGVTLPGGFRQGRFGEMMISQMMPRYAEAAYRKQMFTGTVPGIAGQTTSAGLTATYVGCVLANNPGNTVNAIVTHVSWNWSVIAAAINQIGIMTGYHASTACTVGTAGTTTSNWVGSAVTPSCTVLSGSTLPVTGTWRMFLSDTPTASTNPAGGVVDMGGMWVVPPGGFIATATVTASSALAFWGSWSWIEVPI